VRYRRPGARPLGVDGRLYAGRAASGINYREDRGPFPRQIWLLLAPFLGRVMRIAIHTLGTRGDVQPYLALALGLKAEGHEVLMAAPTQFEAFIGTRGIAFAHLPGEYLDLMETEEARAAMTGGGGFTAGFKLMRHFKPIGRKQLSQEWDAARRFEPELIIHHPKAVGAPHVAERLSCPAVLASPLPGFTPTADFASPLLPFRSVGPFNRASHSIMAGSADAIFRGLIGEWRMSELGLPNRPVQRLRPRATLYAYSPEVVPVPADWPAAVAVTGYWFLDDGAAWQPDAGLRAFLDAGKPPVYVGFGSMPGLDPQSLVRDVADAIAIAGQRGVIATGGGALDASAMSADHIHVIEGAPHAQLFPLISACVHHGGAGTTGAALREGKPSVICPFFGDQPFWGRRIEALGVGPAPIDIRKMKTASLAAAIRAVTGNDIMRRRAMELGARIRREDGVATAIGFLRARGLLNANDLEGERHVSSP
jgi:sterol 3beta-glucosyltransferase